jgi:hypothetical protein
VPKKPPSGDSLKFPDYRSWDGEIRGMVRVANPKTQSVQEHRSFSDDYLALNVVLPCGGGSSNWGEFTPKLHFTVATHLLQTEIPQMSLFCPFKVDFSPARCSKSDEEGHRNRRMRRFKGEDKV